MPTKIEYVQFINVQMYKFNFNFQFLYENIFNCIEKGDLKSTYDFTWRIPISFRKLSLSIIVIIRITTCIFILASYLYTISDIFKIQIFSDKCNSINVIFLHYYYLYIYCCYNNTVYSFVIPRKYFKNCLKLYLLQHFVAYRNA